LSEAAHDDLILHLRNAAADVQDNLDTLARARQRLVLVMNDLGPSGMAVEQRRVIAAIALCDHASLRAAATLEELKVLRSQLQRKEN